MQNKTLILTGYQTLPGFEGYAPIQKEFVKRVVMNEHDHEIQYWEGVYNWYELAEDKDMFSLLTDSSEVVNKNGKLLAPLDRKKIIINENIFSQFPAHYKLNSITVVKQLYVFEEIDRTLNVSIDFTNTSCDKKPYEFIRLNIHLIPQLSKTVFSGKYPQVGFVEVPMYLDCADQTAVAKFLNDRLDAFCRLFLTGQIREEFNKIQLVHYYPKYEFKIGTSTNVREPSISENTEVTRAQFSPVFPTQKDVPPATQKELDDPAKVTNPGFPKGTS